MKIESELVGRTFGDFLFRPQKGEVDSRRSIPLATRLTTGLTIGIPIVAANMDSVTEESMARTLAIEGGIGVIHRGMSIHSQADQVSRVKRSHGYQVDSPLCLPATSTIREARAFIREHNITGILIEERAGNGQLAGLLSNRDIPWTDGHEGESVARYMTPVSKLTTAAPGVEVSEAERLMFENRIEKLPLVNDQGRIAGLITKKDVIFYRRRPEFSKDAKGRLLVGAAIGARGDYLERAAELIAAGVDVLVIDIAHGHSRVMQQAIEGCRKTFHGTPLICGNVGTAEGARFLKDLGADAVKVGIGPGRGCRTRLETAAGVPQLQAIREAWCELEESIPIIADGGIQDDKDIVLALLAGASSVMLGSMLSGTDEAPGRIIEDPGTGQKKKIYRGMTSPQAVLETLYDSEDPDEIEAALATPAEGQETQVPYRGTVKSILDRMTGHLRSAISYAGASSLGEARAKIVPHLAEYLIPLSQASRRESYER